MSSTPVKTGTLSPGSASPAKVVSRATGKLQSVKEQEFAHQPWPTGVIGARASCLTSLCVSSCHRLLLTRQCKIPWIGDAGVEILKKNGVKSYDALKAKFHDFDGDEKKFTEWLEGLGIQRHLAEKSAICYVDKFATQQ